MTAFARFAPAASRRITVMQGEMHVSDEPNVILTTVLGSCISACLYDPELRLGGLNHFLLAVPSGNDTDAASVQLYGVYAMDALIDAMLTKGAARARLRARLYGGASLRDGFRGIGEANVDFARRFLTKEGIAFVGEDVGGNDARRLEFRPTLGLARCRVAVAPPAEQLPVASSRPTAAVGNVQISDEVH